MTEDLNQILETDEPEDSPEVEAKEALPERVEDAEKAVPTEPPVPTEPEVPTEEDVVKAEKEVPLAVALDERDKRKALEAELAQLKAQTEKPPEPEKAPDVFEDPEGNQKYWESRIAAVNQSVEKRLLTTKLDMSEHQAAQAHGAEAVADVKEWFGNKAAVDPSWARQVLTQAHPYDYAIQERKREQLMGQLTADPDKLNRVLAALEGGEAPKQAPSTTATARSVSERSGPEYSGPTSLQDIVG